MPEIESLLPLLLQSLDLQDSVVQVATIESLIVISRENPGAVEGYVSSLVNRLLKAAAEAKGNAPVCTYTLHHRERLRTLMVMIENTLQRSSLLTNLPRQSQG